MFPSTLPMLIGTFVFNTLIAAFLTVVGAGAGEFGPNLVWSQCIGICIVAMVMLARRLVPTGPGHVVAMLLAMPIGVALGVALAVAVTGTTEHEGNGIGHALFVGVFFGAIASTFFWLRERNAKLAAELEARELARVEAEKRSLEAQLRMLQAQIEPHFLFNSLANVSSLIEADPATSRRLLDALIRYLRASLSRTRAERGSLGDEIDLLTSYLDILKIRMGSRLDYAVDVPPELRGLPLPPMLLQPLVENAIRHGLEPKIEGGTIRIAGRREGDRLVLTVDDDGLGLGVEQAPASGGGVGLSNVKARLAALFGAGAQLRVSEKLGAGVTATVEIPA